MTPAMQRALELHAPKGHLPAFPEPEERELWRRINQVRASIMDDNWTAKVWAFRSLFDLHKHNNAEINLLPAGREMLQRKMLSEEHEELFTKGFMARDLVEIVDGILDWIYVGIGTLIEIGLSPEQINLLMEEVHASNVTKVDDQGKPVYNDDGKVLKSHNYVKADVKGLLQQFRVGIMPEETPHAKHD